MGRFENNISKKNETVSPEAKTSNNPFDDIIQKTKDEDDLDIPDFLKK